MPLLLLGTSWPRQRLEAQRKEELAHKDLLNRKDADATAEQAQKSEAVLQSEQAKLNLLMLQDPVQAVKRADADVRVKKAILDQARQALRDHTLRAPANGTVLRVLTNPGELVGPQTPQPVLLFAPDQAVSRPRRSNSRILATRRCGSKGRDGGRCYNRRSCLERTGSPSR